MNWLLTDDPVGPKFLEHAAHPIEDEICLPAALVVMTKQRGSRMGPSRPRYYAVMHDIDRIEERYWEKNRVTVIKASFAGLYRNFVGIAS
jgi:hypothetical protein